MSITIDLSPKLAQALATQAGRHGVSVNAYALDLLQQAATRPLGNGSSEPSAEALEAIKQLRDFGKSRGLSLGGTTIRKLRHEARP